MTPAKDRFSTREVARIAGVSLRQLQWWNENSLVFPSNRGLGHRRVWRQREIREVSVIAELRRKGFAVHKIRRVLRFLREQLPNHADAHGDVYLVTDGRMMTLEDQPARVIDAFKESKQGMFLVCVKVGTV